jgi:hypothetical protein
MSLAQTVAARTTDSLNIFGQPLSIFGVPVERDTIFSDHKGQYKNRVEKRQRKLIVKTTFIKFFLYHDERILCLTTGYSPVSVLEQVLTGPAFLFFRRALFVFTDQRILHIPTRFDHSSQSAISQVCYDDCTAIDLKGRSLFVQYKNGRQELFPYLGRRERKKIRVLLEHIRLRPKAAGQLRQRVFLCPSCTNILNAEESICPTCKLEFKSRLKAKLMSLLIPGGGYLYNRYTCPGVAVGLLETLLLSCLAYDFAALESGLPVNFSRLALFLFAFVAGKLVTSFHSHQLTRDFIPEQKDFAMRKI